MHKNGYIYKNSVFHKMNPAIKFITTILFIVMIFLPFGFLYQFILFSLISSVFFISKLPPKLFLKISLSVFFMGVFLFVINWISFKNPGLIFDLYGKDLYVVKQNWDNDSNHVTQLGGHFFVQGTLWGSKPVTDVSIFSNHGASVVEHNNGWFMLSTSTTDSNINDLVNKLSKSDSFRFEYAKVDENYVFFLYEKNFYSLSSFALTYMLFITMKVYLMILVITILTSTTSSIELTSAIEDIMYPLKYLKLPVNQMAMIIALAIRFIPSLLDESNRVLKAQASRGVDFNNGKAKDKIKSLTSLIVPLFSISFKKAEELANAMEARAYNPNKPRTRYRIYEVGWLGWIYLGLVALLLGVTIGLVFGYHGSKAIIFSTWVYDCIQIFN